MGIEANKRSLMPRFTFQGRTMAWECSLCGKLFSLSFEERQSLYYSDLPSYIRSDFEAHSCVISVYKLAEHIQRSEEGTKPRQGAYESILERFLKS